MLTFTSIFKDMTKDIGEAWEGPRGAGVHHVPGWVFTRLKLLEAPADGILHGAINYSLHFLPLSLLRRSGAGLKIPSF